MLSLALLTLSIDVISQYKRPGIPDHVDDAAREFICLQSVTAWNGPLSVFEQETRNALSIAVYGALDQTLGKYKQTELFRTSRGIIDGFLNTCFAAQKNKLNSFYELETYKFFTNNNEAFETYRQEEFALLHAARKKRRATCYVRNQAKLANKPLPPDKEKAQVVAALRDNVMGPDKFENEIQLAAWVRGYYKTAGLRFSDNLSQSIQGHLFRRIHDQVIGMLEQKLKLNEGDCKCPFSSTNRAY